ncbi:MAG: DUF421 domain-containing protein [Firmicutes bacterium]|nr:DUF421 domain-containing protein [Bacillota bacterium]
MDFFLVILKTLFFYILITIMYRVMGKREVGELSVMDFIVSLFIAELAAISIDKHDENIFMSLIPMILLVVIQIGLAKITLKNSKVRSIIDGNPSVIINRGKVNFKEMLKQRYNLDDLLVQLRSEGVKSIEEVDYAILETSGRLSVFKKEDDLSRSYPLPIIIDGEVQEDALIQIKKNRVWLDRYLEKENYIIKDIFYCFYKDNDLFIIKKEVVK